MTRNKLIKELKNIIERKEIHKNAEDDHLDADDLLLRYIDDEEITRLFNEIHIWYS